MNQRADSRKKNLPASVEKPLINQRSGLLSHTCTATESKD